MIGTVLQGIVGTAGHVDHGKTSLVKALTGCDTDRLPEEKARGMSIDLGFAPCVLRETGASGNARRMVGIVDVPGHRDFIRNMVAGAASMDVLLLVIAADDGVMPQTDEHMKIVRLLRQPRVMVALTKIDMVSPERLEAAKVEVASFLERVGFAGAPIVPVSNKTFDGVGGVLAEIDRLVAEVQGRATDGRAFRMSVERVFSVAGYGTVVTGIPVTGAIRVGEKVELLPAAGREQAASTGGCEWVVRTVQMYKTESPAALASCCCAINLRDLGAEQVARGMVIGLPGVYRATTEMIVAVENATGGETAGGQVWKRRFEARLHTGTAAVEASVKMLVPEGELAAGATGLAHVKLAEPAVVAAGDCFILRSMSPSETLGGGIVLSAQRQRLRRHADATARWEAARTAAQRGDVLAAELLAGPAAILAGAEVLRLTQSVGETAHARVTHAVQTGLLVDLGGGAYAVADRFSEVSTLMERVLERYHRTNPLVGGMMPSLVCKMAGVDVKNFAALAELLAKSGTMLCRNGRLALTRFKPALGERLLALRERLLEAISRAGVNAPARGNLMRDLAIVEADMKVLEKSLLEERAICVLDGNFMGRAVYEDARGRLMGLFAKTETVELGAFRDALGTNRKMALALLDAFDAEGLTRRVAAGRVLARKKA